MTQPELRLRLRQIRLEADGICSFEFVAADGAGLPAFTAGAHIDLHLPEGRVRSYSLANAPGLVDRYVVAVQREDAGRGGSAWMHDRLRVGDVLGASVPANDFPLEEKAHASVFIAGGIGITPILSMIERLDAIDRPWCLYYAARSPEVAAFRERLNALDRGRERVRLCFSSAGSQRLDLAQIVRNAPAGTHFYCCGPTRMIDAFVVATSQCEPETVHFERFAASEAAAVEGGFTIRLQRSGRSIPVLQGQTILDALLDANAPVSYACSTGICGTCLTRVVEGEPDHRDDFLSDDEKRAGKTMVICCSGSKSPELVLDL